MEQTVTSTVRSRQPNVSSDDDPQRYRTLGRSACATVHEAVANGIYGATDNGSALTTPAGTASSTVTATTSGVTTQTV